MANRYVSLEHLKHIAWFHNRELFLPDNTKMGAIVNTTVDPLAENNGLYLTTRSNSIGYAAVNAGPSVMISIPCSRRAHAQSDYPLHFDDKGQELYSTNWNRTTVPPMLDRRDLHFLGVRMDQPTIGFFDRELFGIKDGEATREKEADVWYRLLWKAMTRHLADRHQSTYRDTLQTWPNSFVMGQMVKDGDKAYAAVNFFYADLKKESPTGKEVEEYWLQRETERLGKIRVKNPDRVARRSLEEELVRAH
jgi:hypothetical protein